MIIKVTYNKSTQDLQISNDIGNVLINSNTIVDDSDSLPYSRLASTVTAMEIGA